jgi:hypothetical protein
METLLVVDQEVEIVLKCNSLSNHLPGLPNKIIYLPQQVCTGRLTIFQT